MPSLSLLKWNTVRVPALDEIENAHQQVGGIGRGRRYATQQINHAYAVLLSSQFQGYCRDLHSECVDHLVRSVTPSTLQPVLRAEFVLNRKLDSGNPHPGNIGADFNRLGVSFWPDVKSPDPRNVQRLKLLDELNEWRNAIAHQDFHSVRSSVLVLATIRKWRRACVSMASDFDTVMANHIGVLVGAHPW